MRVMLLVTDFERGGTPLRLARLARRLRGAGLDVIPGCLATPGPVSRELASEGFPTFSCDARHVRDIGALWRLGEHVRRLAPDLIHATLTHANVAARIVGRRLGVPVIGSTATIEVERRWHRWAEAWTQHLERAHIVNSKAVAAHVEQAFGIPSERIHLVPPSLDPLPERLPREQARERLGLADDAFVVAWAGRCDPVKRLEIVLECARLLAELPACFLIAGDGPMRRRLEASSSDLPPGRVRWLGWRPDMVPILSAADAFLFPSRTEGMPNAVLEAMACGLPVVASDIPVLRELSGGESRMLLISGGGAVPYAEALRALFHDAPRRTELGALAAAWAKQALDPQRTVEAVLEVYRRVLESGA